MTTLRFAVLILLTEIANFLLYTIFDTIYRLCYFFLTPDVLYLQLFRLGIFLLDTSCLILFFRLANFLRYKIFNTIVPTWIIFSDSNFFLFITTIVPTWIIFSDSKFFQFIIFPTWKIFPRYQIFNSVFLNYKFSSIQDF